MAIFNFGESPSEMRKDTLHLKEMGFAGAVTARDVWAGERIGKITDAYKVTIPEHGVVLLVVR